MLYYKYLHQTYKTCLANFVFQIGYCSTCQTLIYYLDNEIGLKKATTKKDIMVVRLFLEKNIQYFL